MSSRIWGSDCTTWGNACWPWGQCSAPAVIIPGVDATTLTPPWIEEPWNPYRAGEEERKQKRKRLIELVCKVSGREYNEKKTPKDLKVTVDEIKVLIKSGKIDLDLRLE